MRHPNSYLHAFTINLHTEEIREKFMYEMQIELIFLFFFLFHSFSPMSKFSAKHGEAKKPRVHGDERKKEKKNMLLQIPQCSIHGPARSKRYMSASAICSGRWAINQRVSKPLVPSRRPCRITVSQARNRVYSTNPTGARGEGPGALDHTCVVSYPFISLHRIGLSRRTGMTRITAAGSATFRWTLIWTRRIMR